MKNKFLRVLSFFIFPALVFVFNLFASFFKLYYIYPWFDIPMHFIGGFSISLTIVLFFNFFTEGRYLQIHKKVLFSFLVVACVVFIAVLWEFYEFFLKTFFSMVTQPSLEDTLLDLVMGLFGGIVGAILFRKV